MGTSIRKVSREFIVSEATVRSLCTCCYRVENLCISSVACLLNVGFHLI